MSYSFLKPVLYYFRIRGQPSIRRYDKYTIAQVLFKPHFLVKILDQEQLTEMLLGKKFTVRVPRKHA